jgi:hypothetical protein
MQLMELEPTDGAPTCRWVAVHHGHAKGGNDHIHIVANVIAEDGRRWSEHNDRVRAQNAAAELEREFGLRITEGRGRGTGQRGYKHGELEWEVQEDGRQRIGSQSRSVASSSRQTLERIVRACATAAVDEPDFVARLREEGVVALPRHAKGSATEIAGYAVALRTAVGGALAPIGGGRLARDLTLPRLRAEWPEVAPDVIADAWRNPIQRTRQPPGPALQDRCVAELDALREALRDVDPRDRATWAHVARDAAGILNAWSLRTEPERWRPRRRSAGRAEMNAAGTVALRRVTPRSCCSAPAGRGAAAGCFARWRGSPSGWVRCTWPPTSPSGHSSTRSQQRSSSTRSAVWRRGRRRRGPGGTLTGLWGVTQTSNAELRRLGRASDHPARLAPSWCRLRW